MTYLNGRGRKRGGQREDKKEERPVKVKWEADRRERRGGEEIGLGHEHGDTDTGCLLCHMQMC